MPRSEAEIAATATTVFSASLTLVAILMGVLAVFVGQIGDLESKGLSVLVKEAKCLQVAVVIFAMVSAWCAFWSLLAVFGFKVFEGLYTIPIAIAIAGLFIFVPIWTWGN